MDDREDRNPVVEACLGYAGVVGVMAMDALALEMERTDEVMTGIKSSVRRVDTWQDKWTTLMGMQSGRVNTLHRVQNRVFLTRKLFKNCSEKNKRLYHFLTLGFLTEI